MTLKGFLWENFYFLRKNGIFIECMYALVQILMKILLMPTKNINVFE